MKRFLVPISVVLVAIAAATAAGVLARHRAPGQGGLPSLVLNGGSTTCYMGELRISYSGMEQSAGVAIASFTVKDASALPCTLSGSPILAFYAGQPRAPLHAKLEGFRPREAAKDQPATVVLQPGSQRHSAAFVIATSDSEASGSADCYQVTAIEVGLFPHGKRKVVMLSHVAGACGTPPVISVSRFVSSKILDSYVRAGG